MLDVIKLLKAKEKWCGPLLPRETPLRRILQNTSNLPEITINVYGKNDKDQFDRFVNDLHGTLWQERGNKTFLQTSFLQKEEPFHNPVLYRYRGNLVHTYLNPSEMDAQSQIDQKSDKRGVDKKSKRKKYSYNYRVELDKSLGG